MKKLILTAIIVLLGNIAFCQSYNIFFKVPKWATETMGKDWDLSFDNVPSSSPASVSFNGVKLIVKAGEKNIVETDVLETKKIDQKKTSYGVELKTGENYVLTTKDEDGFIAYHIIKKIFLEDNSYFFMLYSPMAFEGYVYCYDIYQSDVLK